MSLTIKTRIDNTPDQIERIQDYLEQMRRYFVALEDTTSQTSLQDLKNFLAQLDTPQFELDCRALFQLSFSFATHLAYAKQLLGGQELNNLDLLHTTPIINDVSSSASIQA